MVDKGSGDLYYKRLGRQDSLQPYKALRFSLNGPFKWAQLFTRGESERLGARENDTVKKKSRDEEETRKRVKRASRRESYN